MDDDKITIQFGGREYTGRRLTADQIMSMRGIRDDVSLMMDVMEAMAVSAFGRKAMNAHLVERAAGTATIESFIKLMTKFMDASLAAGTPAVEEVSVPETFKSGV